MMRARSSTTRRRSGWKAALLGLGALAIGICDVNAGPPAEPAVVDVPKIGEHGGSLRMLVSNTRDTRLLVVYGYARLVAYDTELNLVPDIVEGIEVEDGRVFTMRLRAGHRWSDGAPFTTEDFRYWWEDVATNEQLSPSGPPIELQVDGEWPQVKIIDERTVR
jgi:peptide/nickel transport system substrate-binding protein